MLEGSCSFTSGEPSNAERRGNESGTAFLLFRRPSRGQGGWLYGQICRVRAVCPHRLSAKGVGVRSSGAGVKKQLGFLMVVTSRGLSCLTTGRLQTHSSRAFRLQVQSKLAQAVVFRWNEHGPWGSGF